MTESERGRDRLASRILDLEVEQSRFLSADSLDTREFVDKMKNINTVQATQCHIRLFMKWLCLAKSENRPPEQIDGTDLDLYIAQFMLTIRKEGDGDVNNASRQYEPSSLAAMHSSIYRYLSSKNYPHNIKSSDLFSHSRSVLSAKMKELKQLGKGNKPHAAQAFTADEMSLLFERGLLGVGKASLH